MTGIIAILVLTVLIVDVPLGLWLRERQRDRERERDLPARQRAAALVQRALDAYRSAQAKDADVDREDLWVRALIAGSGETEADAKAYVARVAHRLEPAARLQVLLAHAAEEQEREHALEVGPELLARNIVVAQETVMRLVPREM